MNYYLLMLDYISFTAGDQEQCSDGPREERKENSCQEIGRDGRGAEGLNFECKMRMNIKSDIVNTFSFWRFQKT